MGTAGCSKIATESYNGYTEWILVLTGELLAFPTIYTFTTCQHGRHTSATSLQASVPYMTISLASFCTRIPGRTGFLPETRRAPSTLCGAPHCLFTSTASISSCRGKRISRALGTQRLRACGELRLREERACRSAHGRSRRAISTRTSAL